MPIEYPETEIRQRVQDALTQNLHFFYQENFLTYRGKTKDSRQLYIEVVSAELLESYEHMKFIGQNIPIRRTRSFHVDHDGVPNVNARLERFNTLAYSEKLLAIALYNSQTRYCFGNIFDYQVPLKESQDDKFGEIDLVAQKGSSIKLLELKTIGKTEDTLLKAILEIYTYYKLISGSIRKFISDFILNQTTGYYFQPGVLIDKDSFAGKTLIENQNHPYFRKLVGKMNDEIGVPIEFFLYHYPSQQVKFRSQTDQKIELVGDIQISLIEL
jgi:hypothetical protein